MQLQKRMLNQLSKKIDKGMYVARRSSADGDYKEVAWSLEIDIDSLFVNASDLDVPDGKAQARVDLWRLTLSGHFDVS